MASDSIFGSSTIDLTSERSQTPHINVGMEKERIKRLKIWDYYQELPESEARENGKLIYGCDQCAFKINQIINFHTHYFKEYRVNIPIKSGRAYYIKEAGQNLNNIMKLYSMMELQDKMLEDALNLNTIKAALLELLII